MFKTNNFIFYRFYKYTQLLAEILAPCKHIVKSVAKFGAGSNKMPQILRNITVDFAKLVYKIIQRQKNKCV